MKPFIKHMAILWSSWMLGCEATEQQRDRYIRGFEGEIETDKAKVKKQKVHR